MSEPTVKDYSEIYRLGQADERRRIIELLEDFMNNADIEPEQAHGIWQVLPLIKGESND